MPSSLESRLAAALVQHMPRQAHTEPHLAAALTQVTGCPGKLLRARLVATAALHHGLPAPHAFRLACAVEYFHTASLVLDDLPCMDDAQMRRGVPCVHRQHGEATAILAALALINRAYALIGEALARQPREVREAATACLDRCLGVGGIVGGQARDLAYGRGEPSAREVGRIAAAKTGALFELALLLPAALARPTPGERRSLHALCVYWGQIVQIADDLRDVICSSFSAGKTTGRDRALARPNFVHVAGEPHARARLARLHRLAHRTLANLTARDPARWRYLEAAVTALWQVSVLAEERHTAAA